MSTPRDATGVEWEGEEQPNRSGGDETWVSGSGTGKREGLTSYGLNVSFRRQIGKGPAGERSGLEVLLLSPVVGLVCFPDKSGKSRFSIFPMSSC